MNREGEINKIPKKNFTAAFKYKNYRYFWIGAILSNIGTWMQAIALNWYVLSVTNSPFYVGLVNFTSNIPVFAFVLFAGVIADQTNKKQIIIWTQVILMILAFLLAILTSINYLSIKIIIIITLLNGLMNAFSFPAWQAFMSDIVPHEDLLNAIALNSAQFQSARLIGPALAGIVLSVYGVSANYYINAVSFITVIIALLLIKTSKQSYSISYKNLFLDLKKGFQFTIEFPVIIYLLLTIGILSFFSMAYIPMMPVFARDILKSDEKGFGILMSANALGAIIGSLFVAYVANTIKKEKIIKFGTTILGIFIILFANSINFLLSTIFLIFIGAAFMMVTSSINTSIQSLTPRNIRGRIMGMFVWMFLGLMPIGALLFGTIAQKINPQIAIIISGIITILTGLVLYINPKLLKDLNKTKD